MKKLAFFLITCSFLHLAYGQNYWQQQVDYNISVSLDDQKKALKGFLDLQYTNNSPDKLDFIWFHLWPNAYKNNNTAFAKQLLRSSDGEKRLHEMTDRGYIDSLDFESNGKHLKTEADPNNIDIIKVYLPSPLQHGEKINITTPFYTKLATYISRSGYENGAFMVCQWYPKPAVYDRKGWHPIPYLDQGEFYSEYGSFKVNITVPSNYIVGATGVLQNSDEVSQYKKIGLANVAAKSTTNKIPYTPPPGASKTLTYQGNLIHDFAWFAARDFVIRYDTLHTLSGKVVDVFTYHHPDGNKNWVNSTNYVKSAVHSYSSYVGDFEYPVVQAVEGPKNESSGGMEYPMITLITSPTADAETLDAVITHEVGHNWFYAMLGTNERDHAWMDEGINSFYQFRYEAEKYRSNSIFGNSIPEEIKKKSAEEFLALIYNALNKIQMDEPIETPAAEFKDKDEYAKVEYIKTAVWMYYLELAFGKSTVNQAIHEYFNEWKFKHPQPEDLKAVFDKAAGKDVAPYFDYLNKKGTL